MDDVLKNKLVSILKKIYQLEKTVREVEGWDATKADISSLAEEFQKLGKNNTIEILQDRDLRELLIRSSKCKIGLGYTWSQTNFWTTLSSLSKNLGPDIILEQRAEVVYLFKAAGKSFEEELSSKTILFVGEKDFSFSRVFAFTHPDARKKIISTSYENLATLCSKDIPKNLLENLKHVSQHGAMIAFGVDATQLGNYAFSAPGKFERIQFNCPFADDEAVGSFDRPQTQKLVKEFLESATPLLEPNKGRLHVSIQQPKEPCPGWDKATYQQSFGLTPQVVKSSGLTFFKALGDIEKRYKGKVAKVAVVGRKLPHYEPYIGKSSADRVNQFIFKRSALDFFDYTTDEGNTDTDEEMSDNGAECKR